MRTGKIVFRPFFGDLAGLDAALRTGKTITGASSVSETLL